MTTVMSRAAREQFLSGLHVGVLSVATGAADGSGTLAVPIWYDYSPDRGVWVITRPASEKGRALATAGRYSLAVQDEGIPYKYVSVEGRVTGVREVDLDGDLVPMSVRYLGEADGTAYAKQWASDPAGPYRMYTMQPERWATSDMTELFS